MDAKILSFFLLAADSWKLMFRDGSWVPSMTVDFTRYLELEADGFTKMGFDTYLLI